LVHLDGDCELPQALGEAEAAFFFAGATGLVRNSAAFSLVHFTGDDERPLAFGEVLDFCGDGCDEMSTRTGDFA